MPCFHDIKRCNLPGLLCVFQLNRLQLLLSPWYEIRSKVCLFSTILRVYAQEIAENRTKIERIQLLGDRSDCTQIVIRYITRPGTLIL